MSSTPSKSCTANMRPTSSASWSLEEIYKNAGNWSLEGDAKLLDFMQRISMNLETRCTSTKNKINQMTYDLNRTNLRLENTTNKMLSLKNLQFMEARVHDETESSVNTANRNVESVSTDSQIEVTTLEAVQIAVGHGMAMLNECYEKVTLKLDDGSDEDEDLAEQSIVYRAKNPHNDRPLPYLIGSKEWIQKWHVGLVDSDDDVSNDGLKTREDFSESSTEDDTISRSVSLPSNTMSESDYSFTQQPKNSSKSFPAENTFAKAQAHDLFAFNSTLKSTIQSNSSDIFDATDDETDDAKTKPPAPSNRVPEITKHTHIEVAPTNKSTLDSASSFFPQNQTKVYTAPIVPLFDDEPPLMDAPVAQPRKPLNLFMDSDDDDDMFRRPQQKPSVKPPVLVPTKNIFDDVSDSEDFAASAIPVAKPVDPPKKSNISNLFDDSPPDDLFDVLISKTPLATGKTKPNNDDDDLFTAIAPTNKASFPTPNRNNTQNSTSPESQTKSSTIATEILDTFNEKPPKTSVASIFDDIDDDADKLFASLATKTKPPASKTFQQISEKNNANNNADTSIEPPRQEIHQNQNHITNESARKTTIFDDIFGDEQPPDDDFADIFGYGKASQDSADKKTNVVATQQLFFNTEDTQNNEPDIARKNTVKNTTSTLFGDESDDNDDLFLAPNQDSWRDDMNRNNMASKLGKSNLFDNNKIDIFATSKQNSFSNTIKDNFVNSSSNASKSIFNENSAEDHENFFSTKFKYATDEMNQNYLPEKESAHNDNNVNSTKIDLGKDMDVTNENVLEQGVNQPPINIDNDEVLSIQRVSPIEMGSDSFNMVNEQHEIIKSTTYDKPILFQQTQEQSTDTIVSEINKPSEITESIKHIITETRSDEPTMAPNLPIQSQVTSKNAIHSGLFEDLPPIDTYKSTSSTSLFDGSPSEDILTSSQTTPTYVDKCMSNKSASFKFASSKNSTSNPMSFGLFDDLPPDDDYVPTNHPTNQSTAPITFDDMPPDDDDEIVMIKTSQKVTKAKAFNIFDDLPPDDDMFATNTKSIFNQASTNIEPNKVSSLDSLHLNSQNQINSNVSSITGKTTNKTVFYEDFADTIIAPPTIATVYEHSKPIGSILHEEATQRPLIITVPKKPDVGNDETDKSIDFNEKLSIFKEPSSGWHKPENVPEAPKPRKLKENININVAALLPGAKRPSLKSSAMSSSGESTSGATRKDDEPNMFSTTSTSSITQSTKSELEDSSRLVGLNKGRAKILVKRRPSTRKGRQDEYRKSQLLVKADEEIEVSKSIEPTKRLDAVSNPLTNTPSIADMLNNYKPEDFVFRPPVLPTQPASSKFDVKSMSIPSEPDNWFPYTDISNTFRKMTPKPKLEPPKFAEPKHISTNIFSEDDDNDDLFAPANTKPKTKNSLKAKNKDSKHHIVPHKSLNQPSVDPIIKSSLFGDDDDNDDDLFGGPSKTPPKPTAMLPSKSLKSNSLFGDDDDDDDLFSCSKKPSTMNKIVSPKVPTATPTTTTPKQSSLNDDPLSDLL